MKLKNILIVVSDIEASRQFYEELFGLRMVTDFDGNMILTEGLVLQEQTIWQSFIQKVVKKQGNDAELYFEENDLDTFLEKLRKYEETHQVEYVNEPMVHDWGQRVVRIYDPDGHIIEVGEPVS